MKLGDRDKRMGYRCPRCGKPVSVRWPRPTDLPGGGPSPGGGPLLGILYVVGGPFFRRFICPDHGPVPRQEFPRSDRRRMLAVSLAWSAAAVACLFALGWALVQFLR